MKLLIIFALFCYSVSAAAQQQLSYNKNFEITQLSGPGVWERDDLNGTYDIGYTKEQKHSGEYAMFMDGKNNPRVNDEVDAAYFQKTIPTQLLKGKKKLLLQGWVKSESPSVHATLAIAEYSKDGGPVLKEVIADTSKHSWQFLKLEVLIDTNITSISVGGVLNGAGKAWFDDFSLYIDGVLVQDIAKPIPEPTRQQIAWLNAHTVPLLSTTPGNNNSDLDSLSKWIGNAKLVGVGEPTHGTSEAAGFKFRLFKYLVETKSFNVLMLEDELPECGLMNEYVLHGTDTALRLLKKYFFPIYRIDEMLDVLEWMKTYNKEHNNKIQFRGMDMQSARVAKPTLQRLALSTDSSVMTLMSQLSSAVDSAIFSKNAAVRGSAQKNAQQLSDDLKDYSYKHQLDFKKMNADTLDWFLKNVDIMKQCFSKSANYSLYRDSCMAKNIADHAATHPNDKIFVWAHDSHISEGPDMMGEWLKKYFGQNYYPIAISTASGTYTASVDFAKTSFHAYPLQEPYPGTHEYYFQHADKPNFILNVETARSDIDGNWLSTDNYFRGIGFMQMKEQFSAVNIGQVYRAIVFIKNTKNTKSYMIK